MYEPPGTETLGSTVGAEIVDETVNEIVEPDKVEDTAADD
jgi:hypothetical protein